MSELVTSWTQAWQARVPDVAVDSGYGPAILPLLTMAQVGWCPTVDHSL